MAFKEYSSLQKGVNQLSKEKTFMELSAGFAKLKI
jgi:hypothetical protein